MFTGEYRHSVDDKGRIAVPSKFRAQLDGGAVVSRWLDACLAIHTRAGWDALRRLSPGRHGYKHDAETERCQRGWSKTSIHPGVVLHEGVEVARPPWVSVRRIRGGTGR